MAGDTKDVELRIRARDYSQKTLDQLTDTLAQLVKAQEEQLAAAKKGEVSARSLEKSYQALENAGKALISQAGLVKSWQNQSAALAEVKTRVEDARRAQSEYLKTVDTSEKLTKEQTAEMRRLASAVTNAERAEAKLEGRLAATGQKLSQAGVDTNNLAQANEQIVAGITRVNAALDKQDSAIENLDGDLRALAAAQERKNQVDREAVKAAADKAAAEEKAQREAAEALAITEKQLAVDRTFTEAQRKQAQAIEEAAQREAKANKLQADALNAAADEAERLSREYEKLARGSRVKMGPNLSGSVKDIADPLNAAMKSLDGIDQALTGIENKTKAANGPLKNFAQTTKELEAAQRSLQNIAGKVDAYTRQMEAVREARAEVQRHRQALAELAAQARSGSGGPELAQQMTTAQAALKRASVNMGEQVTNARKLREELKAVGVDTRNLAAANDQVSAAAVRTRTAVDGLGAAYKKYGAEVEKAGQQQKAKWFDGGRTTLSWVQRIRGEVLALTTAYVGLQAGIGLAQGAVDAQKSTDTINSRLGQMVGQDPKAIADEWDYLRAVTDRLGLSFEKTALSYSKFGIATKGAGFDTQTTRFVFEGLAEAATVARLSTDEFERALRAVEQMMSKGQITAEELKGQLGDALPGAMTDLAKSMGMSVADVLSEMEKGAISAEYVIDLARTWKKQNAEGLDAATNSMQAQLARLESAQFAFRKALADAGFINAYQEFIVSLTKVLQSDEGQRLAQSLSDGFTAVVQILQWCVENLDTLKLALSAFIGINIFGFLTKAVANFALFRTEIVGVAGALGGLITTMRTGAGVFTTVAGGAAAVGAAATGAAGAVGLLTTGLKLLARAVPVLGAALTAYEVYKLLAGDSKKEEAKKAGADISKAYQEGLAGTADPGTGGADTRVYNALGKEIERQQKALEGKTKTANLRGAKAELEERKRIVAEQYTAMAQQAEKGIKDQAKREERLQQIQKLSLAAQALEEKKFYNEQQSRGVSAGNKRIRLAEEIAQQLERIEDDLAKRQAEADPNASFEVRRAAALEAIAHEYDKLINKTKELARTGTAQQKQFAVDAQKTIQKYVEQRQNVEGMKQDQDELQRRERQLNEAISLRSTLYETLQAQRDAGLISEEEFRTRTLENNRVMGEGVANAAKSFRELVEAKKALMRPEEYQAALAQIDAVMARNNVASQNAMQALTFAQKDQARVMDEYQRKQAQIKAEEEAGRITTQAAIDAQAELNNQYRERIIMQAEEIKGLAMAAMNPGNQEAMLALIGQMDVLITKTNDARTGFSYLDQTIVTSAASAIDGAFNGMIDSLEKVVTGQMSVADGFKDMGRQSLLFFAQFMRDIALAILKQQLFNMLKNSGNPYLMAAGAALSAGSRHNGGIVNSGGQQRMVSPSVFAGAARFHEGGLPGLRANEVPTILERGEEVLTRDDPRHVLNGSGGGGGGSNKFVLLDDRARVSEAMQTTEGESATLVNIKKNLPTLRAWLK